MNGETGNYMGTEVNETSRTSGFYESEVRMSMIFWTRLIIVNDALKIVISGGTSDDPTILLKYFIKYFSRRCLKFPARPQIRPS